MNSPQGTFCSLQTNTIIQNIRDLFLYMNNAYGTSDKILIAEGLGLTYLEDSNNVSNEIDIDKFYTFWDTYSNSYNLGNVVSQLQTPVVGNTATSRYTICTYIRNYNYAILRTFFCTENSDNVKPVIGGKENSTYLNQINNIHNYFEEYGKGSGLQACVLGNTDSLPDLVDPADKTDPLNPENPIMYTFCQAIIPEKTEDQSLFISGNQDMYIWCGCYVIPSGFFSDHGPGKISCSPLCNFQHSIKKYNYSSPGATNLQTEPCNQTICAIGEISLRTVDFGGQINFKQICPGCSDGGNCTCVIDASVQGILDKINSKDGGSQNQASFKQMCPNANCFLSEPDGSYKPLTCNTNNTSNTNKNPVLGYNGNGFLRNISENEKFTSINYVIFIIIFIIFIAFIFFAISSMLELDIVYFMERKSKMNNGHKNNSKGYGDAKDKLYEDFPVS